MKKKLLVLLVFLTIMSLDLTTLADKKKKKEVVPPPPKPANGSLFSDSARNVEILVDFKPRQLGDIVFIDVVEGNSASVSSGARHARESGSLGGALIGVAPVPPQLVAGVGGLSGALSSRKYDGKGSTERNSQIRARIAARVIEVLPNGDMRVAAEKSLKINKETEKLVLSGFIRARDVSVDNSVISTSVAELKVTLNGKGIASTDNGPGWLVRLIEKYSPF